MAKPIQTLSGVATNVRAMWQRFFPAASGTLNGEQGDRLASDDALKRLYATMWVDFERRNIIRQTRQMDIQDGRVKQIHNRLARDVIRGGLVLQCSEKSSSATLKKAWSDMMGRVQLDRQEKLKSDARGFVIEGNLPLQLVYDDSMSVNAAIRMPSDTIVAITDMGGRFKDPAYAYEQRDVMTAATIGRWGAWQMPVARLDPDTSPLPCACATT